jgi:hypothetical protein
VDPSNDCGLTPALPPPPSLRRASTAAKCVSNSRLVAYRLRPVAPTSHRCASTSRRVTSASSRVASASHHVTCHLVQNFSRSFLACCLTITMTPFSCLYSACYFFLEFTMPQPLCHLIRFLVLSGCSLCRFEVLADRPSFGLHRCWTYFSCILQNFF